MKIDGVLSLKTSAEVYRCKIYSVLDNASPQFVRYGKSQIIHQLREFECNIYPITPMLKKLNDITPEGSFMGYTNSIETMKWCGPYIMKIRYCSSENFD